MNIITVMLLGLFLTGCSSVPKDSDPVERQLNRSILLDSGINFEIGGLPITLPNIGIGLKLHWRRPTIDEEVDLNLSKLGKWKGMTTTKPKLSSPRPLGAR